MYIKGRKKSCLLRLQGIQSSLSKRQCQNLKELEKKLVDEYKNVLQEEKVYQYQRVRDKWLKEGQACTEFFHMSVVTKKS